MAKFRFVRLFVYILSISFEQIVSPSDAYYAVEARQDIRDLHSCCDVNKLYSKLSCISTSKKIVNDLNSLRQLFKHKLNCHTEQIQNINVNLTEDLESDNNFIVEPDGSGRIFMSGFVYPSDSYCVYNVDLPYTLSILVCSPGCSEKSPCYKKCCKWPDSFSIDDDGHVECVSVEQERSNFSLILSTKMSTELVSSPKILENVLYTNHSSCGSRPKPIVTDFDISEDGQLLIEVAYKTFIHTQNFCLEELLEDNGNPSTLIATVCFSDFLKDFWTHFTCQLIYSAISLFFLGVSLLVFFVIRIDLSIHGYTQFAFIIAAFLFYFITVITNSIFLYKVSRPDFQTVLFPSHASCLDKRLLDICSDFFSIGLLTNVVNMNAHLFWTFWKLKPERKLINWEDFRILVNSLIACWLGAGFLTTLLIVAQYSTVDQHKRTRRVGMAYNAIVVSLCFVTLSLAVGTTLILVKRIRSRSTISSSRTSSSAQNAAILVRLFCVTGLVWTLQILELLVKRDELKRSWLWDTLQFLIYINGVVLFFVYVCNKKSFQSLRKRFPQFSSAHDPEKVNLIQSSSTLKNGVP